MGLAINGDTVHGLAIGGQAFTSGGISTNLTHQNFNMYQLNSGDSDYIYKTRTNLNKFLGHTIMAIIWDTDEGEVQLEEENHFVVCGPFVFKNGVRALDLNDGSSYFTFNSNGSINTDGYSYYNPFLAIIDFSPMGG